MKLTTQLTITATFAVSLLLGACSSTPVSLETKPVAPIVAPVVVAPPVAKTAVAAPIAPAPVAEYLNPTSPLSQKRSIYFDFDQFSVKNDYVPVLEMHGKYLSTHPEVKIMVQGNTDEKGGSEYNLSLGQKRAEAVAKALKIYGVKEAQLEAVSFGKEKPKASGHDEASHAQNRRVDLAYPEK